MKKETDKLILDEKIMSSVATARDSLVLHDDIIALLENEEEFGFLKVVNLMVEASALLMDASRHRAKAAQALVIYDNDSDNNCVDVSIHTAIVDNLESRIRQARSYLRKIFDEHVKKDFYETLKDKSPSVGKEGS